MGIDLLFCYLLLLQMADAGFSLECRAEVSDSVKRPVFSCLLHRSVVGNVMCR